MNKNERIANIETHMESQKNNIEFFVKFILEKNGYHDSEELGNKFIQEHDKLIKEHEKEDLTELSRFYRHIMMFKPALNMILKPGKEYDQLCDTMVDNFNVTLDRIRSQVNDKKATKKKRGPILPGNNKLFELRYFCTVCNEIFEIPPEMKALIDKSSEKIELPKHHEKEMVIKIIKIEKENDTEELEEIKIYPAELLMGHSDSTENKTEYLKILSVGIDIGSSTSHLIFSNLTLKRETSFFNMSNRFFLVNREIIYEGNIIFTPLIDRNTIDIEAVIKFCEEEYTKAGISSEMVDTGAVIVTGETAKKQNAAEIVERLSSESGKFVSASAGPNFESVLGAMGSGVVDLSRKKQNTILNIDIGGGTSNLAISSKGDVISTSCINVGGRLLGIDENFKIWRIDGPTEVVMNELNMNYEIDDIIPEEDVRTIAHEYAKALLEVMRGPAINKIAKALMMTEDLDFSIPVDEISFSGGVAEIIYNNNNKVKTYNDIGVYLAEEIKNRFDEFNLPLIEPENKIRATVIGAGSFSLSVSGSTCFYDENIRLPLENVPIIPVNIDLMKEFSLKKEVLKDKIDSALKRFDMKEGDDKFALYFKSMINPKELTSFAKEIEKALPNSSANQKLILIILGGDGGKMLGLTLKRETSIKNNIFCLDELELEAGDWIDIGAPLKDGEAFPVTIKSLVFNKNKKE